jgi:hypothetical protein
MSLPLATADAITERSHLVEHRVHFGHDILAIRLDDLVLGSP